MDSSLHRKENFMNSPFRDSMRLEDLPKVVTFATVWTQSKYILHSIQKTSEVLSTCGLNDHRSPLLANE